MVSLDRFDTFKAVVEAGSLTAAADLLGQTRAVVSFNLKRLEAELGVTLLQGYALARPQIAPTTFNAEFPEMLLPAMQDSYPGHDAVLAEFTAEGFAIRMRYRRA